MKTKTREDYYDIILNLPKSIRKLISWNLYLLEKIRLSRVKTPLVLNFFITDRCNLRCSHCFYWKHLNKPENELNLQQIEKILRSLKNRLTSVVITGGETYLRGDLVDICKLFDKINHTKKVILTTNGTLPEIIYNKTKKILDETDLDVAVQVSIDGLENTHDQIRGVKGTFKKVLETINKLKSLNNYENFSFTFSTTITKKNYKEIEKLIDYVKNNLKVFHGLQFVRDANIHTYNIDKDILSDFTCKDIVSLEDMESMNKILENSVKNDDKLLLKITQIFNEYAISIIKNKKRFMPCLAGKADGVILTNGDVTFCEFTKPFANLKDYDYNFYKLWISKEADERRKKLKSCVCIHPCNLVNSMRYDLKSIKKIFDAK